MRELGIVLAIIVALLLLSGMWLTPWQSLYRGGIWITVGGFAFGVPAGVMYHLRLYQALGPRGELPRRWYWRPLQYNARLLPDERRNVLAWCYLGGAGFAVICLGLLTMLAGLALALLQ